MVFMKHLVIHLIVQFHGRKIFDGDADKIKINLDVEICIKDEKFIGRRRGEKYWKFCKCNKWMAPEHNLHLKSISSLPPSSADF